MGNFLNSLFGSSQSSTYQPPEILKNTITDLLTRAGTQSQQPYPQYTPDTAASYSNYVPGLVAPFTPNQAQAGQSIANLKGYTAPNFGAATGLAAAATSPLQRQQFSQESVNQYLNPYLNDVVGSAVANINQTNAQQQQQVLGNSIQRGAFGGDRAGIAQAELARQQGLANNATIANLLGQGYSQAQQQFNQQQGVDLATQLQNRNLMSQGALNLANLGTQGQQAALQQAQAQYGYGTAEQQQQQAGLSTAYQQYLNQQMYPYQQLGWYAQLASGTAPSLGGTSTMYSPTYSTANALGMLGSLGTLGNSGASSSNPFATALSGIGNLASGATSAANSFFGLKDGGRANYDSGGRAEYADAGVVPVSPVTEAYNEYNDAVAAGAPYPVLQRLYQKYQQSFRGATPPFNQTAAPAAATSSATATGATTPTAGVIGTPGGGGGGGGNSPVTARNADYSSDFTSSNGPVGGGGYGPYDAGGGPGNTFNSGKIPGGGIIGGILGGLFGGPLGALAGSALGNYNPNEKNVNTTSYDPNYTGVVSSMDGTTASKGLADGLTANTRDQREINQITDPLANGADLAASKSPSSGLLAAIAAIESGGSKNPHTAIGDGGAALGQFQMHNPAARQAAIELGLQYDPKMRSDPTIAPMLAQQYLSDMFNYTGTVPGAIAAYNMGPGGYKAAVSRNEDPTQRAYTQNVLNTGLVDLNTGIMPPGPAPLPPSNSQYSSDLAAIQNASGVSGVAGMAPDGKGLGNAGYSLGLPDAGAAPARDTSGDRANIYSEPAGPPAPDNSDNAQNANDQGGFGDARTNDSSSSEKRGGRIKPHHYAAGGFEPIHMQYGLPSETDIEQMAQDYSGSGAGVLNPQLQALGAKGVLPSAKGGRIGYANLPDGSGAVTADDDDYNLAGNAELNPMGDYSPSYPPKVAAPAVPPTAQQIAAKKRLGTYREDFGDTAAPTKPALPPAPARPELPDTAANRLRIYREDVKNPDDAYHLDLLRKHYEQNNPKMSAETAGGSGDYMSKIPSTSTAQDGSGNYMSKLTQPVTPTVDMSVFNTDPMKDQKPVQVAQAAPTTMNDATKEVAPGINQWYNAPLPADRNKMAALAYFARLSSPGANLGDAANAYAQQEMAREGQERAAMRAQSGAAQERSQSGYLGAETAQKKIFQRGPILNQLVTNPDGTISMMEIPGYDSGFGSDTSQGTAGGQPFNAETYQPTPLDAKLGPVGSPTDAREAINKTTAFDKYLSTDKKRIMGDPEGSKKQFEIDNQEAQALARAASDTQNNLYQQAIAITKLPDHGPLKVGAGSQFRTTAYDYFKTALPPGTLASLGVENPDDLANTYIANKIATVAAQRLGNDAAATWKTILRAAQPGTDLPKAASNELMTAALVAQKRDKDRGAVMQEYGNRSRGYGPSGTSLMNEVNPPGLYLRDQGVLRDLLDNKNVQLQDERNPGKTTTENPATLLMQRKISPAQFDAWVDATYGPQFKVKHLNLSQYLQ